MSHMEESIYTLAGLSRATGLPRRTIQFWADNDILRAIPNDKDSGAPRLFSKRELQLAKMLHPFVQMFGDYGTPLGGLQLISGAFRDLLLDRIKLKPRPGLAVKDAAAGKQIYLVVQIVPQPKDPSCFNATVRSAGNAEELGNAQVALLQRQPIYPPVTIDLTYALANEG